MVDSGATEKLVAVADSRLEIEAAADAASSALKPTLPKFASKEIPSSMALGLN
jgi:hypothetical protein